MRNPENSHSNHLLSALLASCGEHVHDNLETVSLKFGDVLYDSQSKIRYAYFPTTSFVSLVSRESARHHGLAGSSR